MKKTSRNGFSVRFLGNTFFLIVLFFLCIMALLWRNFFTGIFWQLDAPLLATQKVLIAPFHIIFLNFTSKAGLDAQNTLLKNELASTTVLLADRDALYQETLDLKAQFGRDAQIQTILAGVLLQPPEEPYDTLLIDAGTAQGIEVGDLVAAGGTTLVGTVREVHPTTATVELFSSPGEQYNALLLTGATASSTTTSVPIVLEGQGSGSLRAEVPAGTPAAVGDAIVTPGVESGFAGTISFVSQNESESFETLYVTLPINPLELRFVEVWRKE
jgi:cell shape-determining protein MreC